MTTIDLITGFLGSGKTTFIKLYAKYLMDQGFKVCILENDYGAVNVDMMLLQDVGCDLEMVAGGCDYDCHKRRFRTKLISMGMLGYDRVIVEPSGIFDVDEFFDALEEEPLDRWYTIGNVIAIVDARLSDTLSDASRYLLATEASTAGKIVLNHSTKPHSVGAVIRELNDSLAQVRCKRRLTEADVISADWNVLAPSQWASLLHSGYVLSDYEKRHVLEDNDYDSLYFMNLHMEVPTLCEKIAHIFADHACGQVFRIKGFMRSEADGWSEINATRDHLDVQPIAEGQEIIIVIGENLKEDAIRAYL